MSQSFPQHVGELLAAESMRPSKLNLRHQKYSIRYQVFHNQHQGPQIAILK